jgi:glycerol-3-phosphate acyltransferase PlsY
LSWVIGVLACLLWLLIAALFRYSSLATLMAIALATVAAWILAIFGPPVWTYSSPPFAILATILTVLVWAKHHENIARLLRGSEPKIGSIARSTS